MNEDLTTKIGNLFYDDHALERMEERNIFPPVIENALENGEIISSQLELLGDQKEQHNCI